MAVKTAAEVEARIAELEALLDEALSLPQQGSVGATSYAQGPSRIKDLRGEIDRQHRLLATTLNGGLAQRTRRGCC